MIYSHETKMKVRQNNSITHTETFDILYAQNTCRWHYKEIIHQNILIGRNILILFKEQAECRESTQCDFIIPLQGQSQDSSNKKPEEKRP